MSEYDDLVDALHEVANRAVAAQDLRPLLDPGARAQVERLLVLVEQEEDDDLRGRNLLGWLLLYRSEALPGPPEPGDRDASLAMFAACLVEGLSEEYLPAPLLPEIVRRALARAIEINDAASASGDPTLLDRVTEMWRNVLPHVPEQDPHHAAILSTLGRLGRARYSWTGAVEALDEAIEAQSRAVDTTSAFDKVGRGLRLHELGCALRLRYEQRGADDDLRRAADSLSQAADLVPDGHPELPAILGNLGITLRARSERWDSEQDLDDAVAAGHRSLRGTGPDGLAATLSNLAGTLQHRHTRSGSAQDLDESIDLHRRSVDAAVTGTVDHGRYLSALGGVLQVRFRASGDITDLDESITHLRLAVQTIPHDHPDHAGALNALGLALNNRFGRRGTLEDLDEAVETFRLAVDLGPVDHSQRLAWLTNLGHALRNRFERRRVSDDLEQAVEILGSVVKATSPGHPSLASRRTLLSDALRSRFDLSGNPADLDEAISLLHAAVGLSGDMTSYKRRHALGLALRSRFELTGSMGDLDEAIEALRPQGADDGSVRPVYLNGLGGALQSRYERSGGSPDLDEAISLYRRAAQATPADHPELPVYLNNLGNTLRLRSQRLGKQADNNEATEFLREALQATPADHPQRALFLSNLAGALLASADPESLDEAIELLREAKTTRPDEPLYAGNLGGALRFRAGRTNDPDDLDEAIGFLRRAAELWSAGHPVGAESRTSLGEALKERFDQSGVQADRDEALQVLTEVTALQTARPSARMRAGRAAGNILAATDVTRAAAVLEEAVLLLGELAPRSLDGTDQLFAVGKVAGLAAEAAALVLSDESRAENVRAATALTLLEFGRARVMAQRLETRTETTALRERYPALAERFLGLRDILDRPEPLAQEKRLAAARDLEEVLTRIRELPGLDTFARPPDLDGLRRLAGPGPIVTFNVTDHRSDALILTRDDLLVVPLPGLEAARVLATLTSFSQAQTRASNRAVRMDAEHRILEILGWLWDTATEPVLRALGFTSAPDGPWPRVWWAPGGLLGLLPLHAAGHHADPHGPGRRTVMDRVISSYTPLAGALRYARRPASPIPDRTLIVAMPTTPGMRGGNLPKVAREARTLAGLLPRPATLIEPDPSGTPGWPHPTFSRVLAHLAESTIAHFSCHGVSDPADPSRSRLLLHDHATNPLTVANLAPLDLDHARLAFLSACSTATTWNRRFLDESVHLTSAFHLAGFSHVIGTLWPIDDHASAETAQDFYTRLVSADGTLHTENAAQALHLTLHHQRERWPLTPSLWAPYLHVGA